MRAQVHQLPLWGEPEILWMPEHDRVNSVIVKNARGMHYTKSENRCLAHHQELRIGRLAA